MSPRHASRRMPGPTLWVSGSIFIAARANGRRGLKHEDRLFEVVRGAVRVEAEDTGGIAGQDGPGPLQFIPAGGKGAMCAQRPNGLRRDAGCVQGGIRVKGMITQPTQLPGPEAICSLARATREKTAEPLTDGAKPWVVTKETPDLEWHLRKVKTSLVWAAFVECEAPDSPWWERRVDSRPSHDRTLNEPKP